MLDWWNLGQVIGAVAEEQALDWWNLGQVIGAVARRAVDGEDGAKDESAQRQTQGRDGRVSRGKTTGCRKTGCHGGQGILEHAISRTHSFLYLLPIALLPFFAVV